MSFLWFYVLVILIALIWAGVDKHAPGTFEFLRRNNRASARQMGMYLEFTRYSLGRLAFLTTLVTLNIAVTFWMFAKNPFGSGQATRWTMLAAMLAGSLGMLALPSLAARFRFLQLLYSKTAQLTGLVAIAKSESDVGNNFDVAAYDTLSGWTAWHPKQQEFQGNTLWSGMIPAIYLRQGIQPVVVIPIDFKYFLAWKFPYEVRPGEWLPFSGPGQTKFLVKTIHNIPGRRGWSVVRTEMNELDVELAAA